MYHTGNWCQVTQTRTQAPQMGLNVAAAQSTRATAMYMSLMWHSEWSPSGWTADADRSMGSQ